MINKTYIVAAIKPWHIAEFYLHKADLPGDWHLVTKKEELTIEMLERLNPRYIFFPHWSWIVPDSILSRWECVCFHMADVPYGRGGSPLQNLIVRGHQNTKLTALRMTNKLDAGPVYKKVDLSLGGSAQDIFVRMAPKIIELEKYIVANEPEPEEQEGEIVEFIRRTPKQSVVPIKCSENELLDHIRMLDAETYPKAYLDYGEYRLEFDRATKDENGQVVAKVVFTKKLIE